MIKSFFFFISCSVFINLLCLIPESVPHQLCMLALFSFLSGNMHCLVSDSCCLVDFRSKSFSSLSFSINTTVVFGQATGASQRSSKKGCVHYSCNTKLIVYVSDEYLKKPVGHLTHTDFSVLVLSMPLCVFLLLDKADVHQKQREENVYSVVCALYGLHVDLALPPIFFFPVFFIVLHIN